MVAARALQGLGGAMMVPVGRLLLLRRIRKEELLSVTTWLTMPGLLGPLLGPPVGGLLTDLISWRAVFWINIPVGMLGLLLVWRIIPALPPSLPPPPDLRGLTLVGTALAALMAAFETLGRGLLPPGVPEVLLAAGFGLSALAVWHCRRTPNPALDFSLLAIPSFRAPHTAGLVFRIGAGAVPFLVPLTLQLGFGASAAQSGMVSFATALGAFAMKPMAQFALRRFGFRNVMIWNAVCAALTIAACAAFRPGWPMAAVFVVLLLGGLFRSLHFTTLNTLAYADVPQEKLSAATSLYSTAQQLPLALGVVVASASLQVSMAFAGRDAAAMPDFTAAFLVGALLTLLAAPLSVSLPRDAGRGSSAAGGAEARMRRFGNQRGGRAEQHMHAEPLRRQGGAGPPLALGDAEARRDAGDAHRVEPGPVGGAEQGGGAVRKLRAQGAVAGAEGQRGHAVAGLLQQRRAGLAQPPAGAGHAVQPVLAAPVQRVVQQAGMAAALHRHGRRHAAGRPPSSPATIHRIIPPPFPLRGPGGGPPRG
ncbi:MFS transporter [Teichococcus aestuarii]|uniref:MFS transporter n=1 Tax=Teichococcus aestuarii TaxID=568898 RepID=UPI003607225D